MFKAKKKKRLKRRGGKLEKQRKEKAVAPSGNFSCSDMTRPKKFYSGVILIMMAK